MKIEAHLLCWNEKDIMPFVISHYQSFCDKVIIHDNHSTDGSAELAREMGCEVIPFGDKTFNDQHNMDVKNSCWKGSDADWVIVADFDELLWLAANKASTLRWYLELEMVAGQTMVPTTGWQIMSDDMPKEKLTEISNGYYFKNYSKSIIFNPKKITSIGYGPGAHECSPEGEVNIIEQSPSPLFVLHYKHIGGVQRTIARYKDCCKRLSKKNRQMGWGSHNCESASKLRREWKQRMEKSKPLY